MNLFSELFQKRRAFLKRVVKEKERAFRKAPEGRIRISLRDSGIQYYRVLGEDNHAGSYIRQRDKKLIIALVQKDYDQRVLKQAKKELEELDRMEKIYSGKSVEDVYFSLPDFRRELITPVIQTDEQFAKQWQEEPYRGKMIGNDVPVYLTEKGERVRSKSEVILANKFYTMEIPYKYEHPLLLQSGEVIYPDFTGLNVRERKVIYTEHLGMMSDPDYCEAAMERLSKFIRNGIFPGDQLCLTWETQKQPLNILDAEKILRHYYL